MQAYWKKISLSIAYIVIIACLTFFTNISIFQETFVKDIHFLILQYGLNYFLLCSIVGLTIIYSDIVDKRNNLARQFQSLKNSINCDCPSKIARRYGRENINLAECDYKVIRRLWEDL